jgi:multidrug efflux pump subunit AcrA (membrane-fusion protein)
VITDLSQLQLRALVHEAEVHKLREGQTVRIRIDAYPNRTLEGKIATISPTASQSDWVKSNVKVYPVSIALTESDLNLKPGMSAEAQIVMGEVKNVLRVPLACVMQTANKKSFCEKEDGTRWLVTLGARDDKFVEIKEGLAEGDKVVIPEKL